MQDAPRHHKSAIYHGFRHSCPSCGQGKLFKSYLKVAHACAICGQSFTAQKADDGPAYFTILIMCHIAGFMLHAMIVHTDVGPWQTALLISGIVIAGSLLLLPRIKGAMIGWQWADRLHGF
ncbi:DUF983 domain-containing protein (plasmid) [Gemmobacter fulvus]|uniref:DUF983 domain-containing protein n=1 Tax=Gemmobacter fulvus TaxID=2840474 RepID=A0A975PB16_9RHOB|nr:DUF983 domain-containing protein [Gemmobacter fulvus]MBT9246391.1 DUF983 domain-containing protein [Gemmobacter fulvus]MDQ1849802.1 DUF983 domain-containing protein [Gemmobacter fulvus]QWK92760.1 DUF983 domain-containing protein [Gemmobacter fulvus]